MAESLEVRRATTSVSVDIYDQTYHLRASDPDYIQKLAAMVDGKMRAVSANGSTVDSLRVAVLAALNIASPEIIGAREGLRSRALLTRDRWLLMHKVVRHGYYPRSQDPAEQIIEVMRRFDLFSSIAPFTRCLRCNALLEKVEKGEVIEKLEPLTRIHYEQFRRCTGCGQIYWPGSHFDKLRARIEGIRAMLAAESRSENQT